MDDHMSSARRVRSRPRRARAWDGPLCAAVCLLLTSAAALARQAPTTVLLVRHAEKVMADDTDPALSPAGERRARALVRVAAEAGVSAIYSTPYRRTQATVRPLAEQLGLPVRILEIGPGGAEAYAAEQAQRIREEHGGQVVLVVSHSNTVPLIIEALGGPAGPALDESDYDNLFIVRVPATGPVRLIRARYGEPDGRG